MGHIFQICSWLVSFCSSPFSSSLFSPPPPTVVTPTPTQILLFLVFRTQFAGGVFLGTALMHFLSDSNETFGDLTKNEYPFAFMLASAGCLLTMWADCIVSYVYGKGSANHDVELQDPPVFYTEYQTSKLSFFFKGVMLLIGGTHAGWYN
ncbi:hypothetical protein ACS0TY_010824 [Phlomoides rotata]